MRYKEKHIKGMSRYEKWMLNIPLFCLYTVLTVFVCGLVWNVRMMPEKKAGAQKYLSYQDYIEGTSEDDIENNIRELAKIEEWRQLDDGEKTELLQIFLRVRSHSLGMDTIPELRVLKTEDKVGGYYSRTEDYIAVSRDVFDREDGYAVLTVLFHEVQHRYQFNQADLYRQLLEEEHGKYNDYLRLRMFDEPQRYMEEFQSYIGADNPEDLEAYRNQLVEKEADDSAQEAICECYEKIRRYKKIQKLKEI